VEKRIRTECIANLAYSIEDLSITGTAQGGDAVRDGALWLAAYLKLDLIPRESGFVDSQSVFMLSPRMKAIEASPC
jgi:hypothetical protein